MRLRILAVDSDLFVVGSGEIEVGSEPGPITLVTQIVGDGFVSIPFVAGRDPGRPPIAPDVREVLGL